MLQRTGLADVRPRTAAYCGLLAAVAFVTASSPDPRLAIQLVSAVATVGSFGLAIRNRRLTGEQTESRSVRRSGDGPQTAFQMGDNHGTLVFGDHELDETTDEPAEASDDTDP